MNNSNNNQQELTNEDISQEYKDKIYVQSYAKKTQIDGVQIVTIQNIVGEDGDFGELARLNDQAELEGFPGFKVQQISRTKLLSKAIKGWHLHYKQEDIWFIFPDSRLLVGLWDVRKDSQTKDMTMRIAAGGGKAQLIYIPRGVAHGVANLTGKPGMMLYFVNQKFNAESPDEERIHWDAKGADFWKYSKD